MGLFDAIGRFFSNLFGMASGAIEEASDSMASGSPGAIKAQFRRTREEWLKQYNEMRDAVSQLMVVREQKKNEMEKLQAEEEDLLIKMEGALNEAEKAPENPQHGEAYERFFNRKHQIDQRQEQLDGEIRQGESQLKEFKERLLNLQSEIKKLEQEEAETIADIISSKKIIELNDRISNLSTDNISQSLQSIRNKREKLKAKADLSGELSKVDIKEIDKKYKDSGKTSAGSEAFAKALAARRKKGAPESEKSESQSDSESREL
jgi:phage shock protein A